MRDFAAKFLLKRTIVVSALFFVLSSCSTEKEIVRPVEPPPPPPPVVAKPLPTPPPAPKLRVSLQCREDTKRIFNRCGIEALPFVRTAFYDMDGDGTEEMIAGSKDGSLRLYKNYGTAADPEWRLDGDYFHGISAGAFSAPAAGDIDGDGKPEIIIGTGGFSSDSGRVLVFRNEGTAAGPVWKKVEMPEIRVGNDAAPAVIAMDVKGRPDLIVGNSEGRLFLFRNVSRNGQISFRKDAVFFRGVRLGMYAVPAVSSKAGKIYLVVGNDMGKLFLFEHADGKKGGWSRTALKISTPSFASPSFIRTSSPLGPDLVMADGGGQIHYFKNVKGNFLDWEESPALFAGRVLPGPACTPVMGDNGEDRWMTSGNIHGEMKLFEFDPRTDGTLPVERKRFFEGIKLSGFSRGVLTQWQGKALLVTGQQDGLIRAFINSGSIQRPSWHEQKNFFAGLPKMLHASPALFDLDGDGRWELIVGDVDGTVQGFRYGTGPGGDPSWEKISGVFDRVKVERYASPAFFRDAGTIYLLVGEQDGRISVFTIPDGTSKSQVFQPDGFLDGILVKDHSSPSAMAGNGGIELAVGDYDGNLRHFACRKVFVEAKGK